MNEGPDGCTWVIGLTGMAFSLLCLFASGFNPLAIGFLLGSYLFMSEQGMI